MARLSQDQVVAPHVSSIRTKLTLLVLGVSLLVLWMAGAALMLYDIALQRESLTRDLTLLSEVVGNNSKASMAFDDPVAATRTLAALSANEAIQSAWLLGSGGEPFAHYSSPDFDPAPLEFDPEHHESRSFTADSLVVTQEIRLEDVRLGFLQVRTDLRRIRARERGYVVAAGAITFGSLLFAFVLSSVLQRWITHPVLELEELANRVTHERDYTLRAEKLSHDEVGQLVDAFNEMLDQIQERDSELSVAKDSAETATRKIAELFEETRQTNQSLQVENRDRKRAEQMLLSKTEELERSNVELQQFAYVASHDLQEPLRMVTMFTQLLKRKYEDRLPDDAVEYIGHAVDGAERMRELIHDLLEYSRVGRSEMEFATTDLNRTVSDVLSNLHLAIEESEATIEVADLPEVVGNSIRLFQLFQNLIANALKFRGEAKPHIRIGAEDRDGSWEFSVKDNGIGIDPVSADRVFMVFQRLHTRNEYDGTGIGLAVCKKIVDSHGGRIWVEPGSSEGSDFRFTLPRSNEPTEKEVTYV